MTQNQILEFMLSIGYVPVEVDEEYVRFTSEILAGEEVVEYDYYTSNPPKDRAHIIRSLTMRAWWDGVARGKELQREFTKTVVLNNFKEII